MELSQLSNGLEAGVVDADELLTVAIQLNKRYETYRRQHGFIKDVQDFRCADHKFMVIKEEEARGAKAAGVSLGSEDGRITTSFLQGVLDKYSDGSVGSQGLSSHISSTCPAAQSRYSSAEGASNAKGEISGAEPPRIQIPQRSFTVAVREPVTGLGDFKSTSSFTDLDFTLSA